MREIRPSAKALIIREGKMLAIRLRDGDEEWYIMPGGGQDSEESLPDAVRREVAEETGLDVEAKELLFVVEGVRGERFHRIDLVFRCEYRGRLDHPALRGDTNQVGMAWLPIESLNRLPLYPSKLRRPIMNYFMGRPCGVYLGNEEIGDPEIVD